MLLRIQGAYHRAQPRGTSAHVITPRTFHNLGPSGSPRGPGGDPPKAAWRGWRTRGDRVAGVRVAGVRVAGGRAGPDQARGSGHPASGIGQRAAGTAAARASGPGHRAPGTAHQAAGGSRCSSPTSVADRATMAPRTQRGAQMTPRRASDAQKDGLRGGGARPPRPGRQRKRKGPGRAVPGARAVLRLQIGPRWPLERNEMGKWHPEDPTTVHRTAQEVREVENVHLFRLELCAAR